MSSFTIILQIIILVLIASDVFFLWKIFKTIGSKKKSIPDERYFELKYNINLLKAVSAILIFLFGFLGFTTYKEITKIVESDFEKKFEVQQIRIDKLDSIVKDYEKTVQLLKSEEGKSIENLNDVRREFGIINKKVFETQESLKYTTKVFITNQIFNTDKGGNLTQKYWFKDIKTIYQENLPRFKKSPLIITQAKNGVSLIIVDISKDYVELKTSQETRMLYDDELAEKSVIKFNMWIAEPN